MRGDGSGVAEEGFDWPGGTHDERPWPLVSQP